MQAYYGIEDDNLWRLATGLGAGISRRGSVCGALTGGAAALGLVSGHRRRSGHDDRIPLREDTYTKTQHLMRRFEERFGTIECMKMTNCDFMTPEGRQAFKDTRQMDLTCIPAVRLVIENVVAFLD